MAVAEEHQGKTAPTDAPDAPDAPAAPDAPVAPDAPDAPDAPVAPVARILGGSDLRIWGMTAAERLRRSLNRAGVATILEGADVPPDDRPVILLRGDFVFDDSIIAKLVDSPDVILRVDEAGGPVLVAAHAGPDDRVRAATAALSGDGAVPPVGLRQEPAPAFGAVYREALRKRDPAWALRLDRAALPAIERRMFGASYKGVTDFVTKYLLPVPAFHVTKLCAKLKLSPNLVTTVSLALVVVAAWAFGEGWFVAGLAAAWVMTFLDTVDGKLARVTLTSTPFGNIYDHGIDLVHPPFWYVAWGLGLGAGTAGAGVMPLVADNLTAIFIVIVAGYVLGRVVEGIFLHGFGMQIHIWRRTDSRFRLITARRNPNMVLLTLSILAGRPDLGLLAVLVWTVLSLVFHLVRLAQAAAARRHGPLVSWLAGAAGPE